MKNFKMAWPKRSTPEDLEMDRRIELVVNFGAYVIAITSNRRGYEYEAAIYGRGRDESSAPYSCEDEIFINREIAGSYPDEGHAIMAAMEYLK